jgi:hypothetical protein
VPNLLVYALGISIEKDRDARFDLSQLDWNELRVELGSYRVHVHGLSSPAADISRARLVHGQCHK